MTLATHGLTPDTYRERYSLKADYPMVAPNYSKFGAEVAKQLGLGRKRSATADAVAQEATASEVAPVPAPMAKPKGKRSTKTSAKADA
ncbi:MucR family transcriptional regulator [Aureimonas sp. AU22]|uniref:MucR family transcriptional regulator n=1 Tax=Aureimonas sp. AU22 TaxID=1638162 RepID=UPI00237891F2|nr:MucR family transcriptional regulator [Aureimonas sp. AU22]